MKFTESHKQKISNALKKGAFFKCLFCGKEFWRKPYDIKNGNNKYCSKPCYFEGQKGKSKDLSNRRKYNGKNNPNWKGGITPENNKIRHGDEFKKWRLSVFKRDNWTCQKCKKRSTKNNYLRIEAHHIKPFAVFPEFRLLIDNGRTLCKKCHSKEPKGTEIFSIYNKEK